MPAKATMMKVAMKLPMAETVVTMMPMAAIARTMFSSVQLAPGEDSALVRGRDAAFGAICPRAP
eukprot:6080348-Pleurochrysis_carterae.AAC.1